MASPLYPGYFPGKPVYRDKRPYLKPQPTELGGLDQVMSEIVDSVHNNLDIPKWIVDQEMESIKAAFTISAAKRAPTTERVYGVEELEDEPGANISVKLDFKKFSENPEKYLTDTFFLKPLASVIDVDEMQAISRSEIVKELVSNEKSPFYLGIEGITASDVKSALATGAMGPVSADTYLHQKYGTLGVSAKAFAKNSAATSQRNKKFVSFNENLLDSVSYELTNKGAAALGASASTAVQINEAKNLVSSRSAVVSSLKSLNSSMGDIGETMTKDTSFLSPLGGTSKVSPADVSALRSRISEVQTSLASLSSTDRKSARNVEQYVNRLNANLDRFIDASGKIKDPKGLDLFLKTEGAKLYRSEFDQGLAGSLTSRFARDTANNKKVLNALDAKDSAGNRIFSKASVNALRLSRDLQTDWDYETLDDLLTSIKDGKLPTQFVWNRVIQPRVERYTPSYWIGRSVDWYTANTKTGVLIRKTLTSYRDYWDKIQLKLKKIPFIGVVGTKNWEVLKKKIANAISEFITKAIDLGTEGIGLLFDRVIKVVVRFVVEKTMDLAMNVWKAAVKLDFEKMEELLAGGIKSMIPFLAGCLTPFAVLGVFIFFLMIIFTGVLPEDDATKEPGPLGELVDRLLPWFGDFNSENCPIDDVLTIPFANDSSNAAASEGYNLVAGLKRGFWCYWNHQPDYDDASDRADLFDEVQFQYNSFPAALNECADCLFWCTWLPYIAYQNIGQEFDPTISYLGAQRMNDWFKAQAASGTFTYILPDDPAACSKIEDGDIVFWNVAGGTGWHVSMVYNVDSGTVNTIHSNAPYKWLPLLCDGSGVQDPPGGTMSVVGFGRPSN